MVVVGGGNSATEESLFLTTLDEAVTLVTKSSQLSASAAAVAKVEQNGSIEVKTDTSPVEFVGREGEADGVVVEGSDGVRETLPTSAAFVFVGLTRMPVSSRTSLTRTSRGSSRRTWECRPRYPASSSPAMSGAGAPSRRRQRRARAQRPPSRSGVTLSRSGLPCGPASLIHRIRLRCQPDRDAGEYTGQIACNESREAING